MISLIPNLVMTNRASHGFSMALIEIDGLPINNMVDLSMAIAVNVITRG